MTNYNNIFYNKTLLTYLADFCDIPELLVLKSINKCSSRLTKISFASIVKRIENNKYKIIPTVVANRLYLYFLNKKDYNSLIKVIPFTESIVSYRIFINIDVKVAVQILGMIRRTPRILRKKRGATEGGCRPPKEVWRSPYHIVKETFGLNLEVFKYAVDLCVVYGLTYLLNEDEFYCDTEEDIPFLEYIENNIN
jgi:hypothetical protein